ncbi:MAG: tetratricopeptide repeat protein, partial [Atribacterota bacterium]
MDAKELYERGEEFRATSQFRKAVETFRQALEVVPLSDSALRLLLLRRLGDCLRMVGNFEEAKSAYSKALEVAQEVGDDLEVADSLVGLGLAQRGLGELEEAFRNFEKAREIYEEYDDPEGEAFTLWALGGLFRVMGELKKA